MFILVHTAYGMPHIIYNIKRLKSQEIFHACLSNMSKCVSYDAKCQFKNNSEFVVGPGTVRDKLIRIQPKYKQMVLTCLTRLSLLSFSIFSKHSKHKYHKFVSWSINKWSLLIWHGYLSCRSVFLVNTLSISTTNSYPERMWEFTFFPTTSKKS